MQYIWVQQIIKFKMATTKKYTFDYIQYNMIVEYSWFYVDPPLYQQFNLLHAYDKKIYLSYTNDENQDGHHKTYIYNNIAHTGCPKTLFTNTFSDNFVTGICLF